MRSLYCIFEKELWSTKVGLRLWLSNSTDWGVIEWVEFKIRTALCVGVQSFELIARTIEKEDILMI